MTDCTAPLEFLDKVDSYGTQPMNASALTACNEGTKLKSLVQMCEIFFEASRRCNCELSQVRPFGVKLAIRSFRSLTKKDY